jgi:Protein of unknown function (DUF3295)
MKFPRKKLSIEQFRNTIGSDVKEDELFEDAIEDDDDSSDWQTSLTESSRASIDKELFKRLNLTSKQPSQQSLLTSGLQKFECPETQIADTPISTRASQSQSSSLIGLTITESPKDDQFHELDTGSVNISCSAGIEIARLKTGPITYSPGTNRRKMFAAELANSLARQILQERQQNSTIANAGVPRRHNTIDPLNLKVCLWDYHTRGW